MTATELQKIDISGDGGVQKEILKEGTGDETAHIGRSVSLHYTGRLTDGTVFDSSVDRGEPFEFELGKGSVIKAFDLGVATMKLGEKCNLICAPNYAYGAAGSPPSIPPDSTLIFELEMLGWKGKDISPEQDGSIEYFVLEKSERRRLPKDGSSVKVHITGKYNDNVFEEREVQFVFGEGADVGILEGVEIAISKMVTGEVAKIKIKPAYAFGTKGCPERNIPPNATIEYTIKLIDCEKGLEDWKLSDNERLEQAKIYKEKGTTYFKKQDYPLAIKMYKKCVSFLENNSDNESNKLKVAAISNQVLCYQKTNEEHAGKQACNEVLGLEPRNIKILYRRGQCNLAINENHEALNDFQHVMELDPSNKAAQNQILICKRKIKEANDKEKKIYANMFSKLAANDKQQEPQDEPDVLAKCGEWTDEDTKREVDRAFERDNNIVMI
uniref:peptidylprolyl isomerase n=1 Tax=Glossina brevipalpis TaxID=37001 RepID=A0A1A9W034_9MUSC